MAVYKGDLVMGSFGKEYANMDGTIRNHHNVWIATVDSMGNIRNEDWSRYYDAMRTSAGMQYPAYIMHEAGLWSAEAGKWIFLPRRMSTEPYHEVCLTVCSVCALDDVSAKCPLRVCTTCVVVLRWRRRFTMRSAPATQCSLWSPAR
jgi:hypothetical protein